MALLHPLRGVIHTATVTHEMAITCDSAENGGWGLRYGCRCGTWCGTPWIESVIIHRSRERICVDKTASKSAISGRTDISLSWSGSVEHDQSRMHIRKGIRLNARIMRNLTASLTIDVVWSCWHISRALLLFVYKRSVYTRKKHL